MPIPRFWARERREVPDVSAAGADEWVGADGVPLTLNMIKNGTHTKTIKARNRRYFIRLS